MRVRTISKAIAAALSAAMLVTSLPAQALAAPGGTPTTYGESKTGQNLLKLWYDEPASEGVVTGGYKGPFAISVEDNTWQQFTLPIGNSFMGANVYGEIANERLTFNQKTLWNGGPSASRSEYNGGNKNLVDRWQQTVNAFLEGDDSKGTQLASGLTGQSSTADNNGFGTYQPWGDIYLTYKNLDGVTTEQTTGYERNLDFTEAVANVDFTANGTAYHREYFISYPDNVLAMKLTADGTDTLDVNVKFPVDNGEENRRLVDNNDNVGEAASEVADVHKKKIGKENTTYAVDAANGSIVMSGNLEDNQMKMNSVLKAVTDQGTVAANDDGESLDISGAKEVVIYISASTDYKNDYPAYRTGETDEELAARVKKTVDAAEAKGYDEVKNRHLQDYQELFGRVSLNLGQAASDKTTDQLLKAYNDAGEGKATESERRLLEVLLYQYGRYMTIASSREGDLPANLQGVWQNRLQAIPWQSDYHMNVNLQMNYWPTYSANLAECATPIVDYVNSLREPGRVTAEQVFGIKSEAGEANGFTANTQNNIFGWTAPGDAFSWGWSPAAVPWIIQNCWEYYEYTGDKDYMKKHLYPMMKEETIFYDQILVDSGREITLPSGEKSTRLVSAPSYSSEHGPYTLGNVYDNVLIWQLYEDTIKAANELGVDGDLVERWEKTKERLAPIEIGDSGQIKEWYNEGEYGKTETGEPIEGFQSGHRHMSHMLGIFPGDLISVDNKDYMDAAITVLDKRGYTSTGWGMGQRINAWARTGDGNTSYRLIQNLFRDGMFANLWDAHPPFQIDGNFGYTSGVNEMLMQSNIGYVNVLPSLPDVWSQGSVNGIVARGNFEIGIDWEQGKATEVRILSRNGGECTVQCTGIDVASIKGIDGSNVAFTKVEGKANRIKFNTEKGQKYTITGFGEDVKPAVPTKGAAVESGNDIALTWDAVADADSYNVYRKVNIKSVAEKINTEAVTTNAYTDSQQYDDKYAVLYYVAAVKNGVESEHSEGFKLPWQPAIEVIDETDERVKYVGNWESWTEAGNYGGAMKFIETVDGTESVELPFNGTGIAIVMRKRTYEKYYKQWKVYIDGKDAGLADCRGDVDSGPATYQNVTFAKYDLEKGEHTFKLTTEGNAGGKLEVDAFVVYADTDAALNVSYDLNGAAGTVPSAATAKCRDTITLPSFDKEGFLGWSDGNETYEAGASYQLSYSDVQFTAQFQQKNTTDEYIPFVDVPKEQWTATAGSEQGTGDDGPASWAIDGNEATWWHSNWGNGIHPTFGEDGENNEFTIDFGQTVEIGKFEYVPRKSTGANGFITKYKILYSESADGEFKELTSGVWAEQVDGAWAQDMSNKSVEFGRNVSLRRIQIKAIETDGKEGMNRFIHAAEFNVYKKNPDYIRPVFAAGIETESDTIVLESGESKKLVATVTPDDAEDKTLTYSSSDTSIVYVYPDGRMTASAYKSGEATITISSVAVPSVTKTVTVKVNPPAEKPVDKITLSKERIILKVGETATVDATIEPYFGTDKRITWASGDPGVATVTDGKITAVAAGKTNITATAANDKTATCEVVVTEKAETADRRELSSTVLQFKALHNDLSQYTQESADAYIEALTEAERVLALGTDVLQSEIDAALQALLEAEAGLSQAGNSCLIRYSANPAVGGTITAQSGNVTGANGVIEVPLQDSVTLTAEAADGYTFDGWYQGSKKVGSDVRLTITKVTTNASYEARFTKAPVDKSALEGAIEAFQSKYAEETKKYSDAVKEAYQEALDAAQAVMNKSDATKQQVDAAVTALGTADEALQTLIGNEKTAGKDTFKTTIANIKKEYGEVVAQYSQEVQTQYNNAIEAAEAALNDPAAGKEQIDAAVTALNTAIEALKAKMDQEDEGKTADKTELQTKLNAFKQKYENLDAYSDAVKQTFEAAAARAQEVLDKENPTVKEANDALRSLALADQELADQIEKETTAGKPDFKDKIKEFKAKYPDLSQYSQEVQNAFKDAVSNAESVLNNPEANKDDIDAAILALQKAGEALDAKIEEEDGAQQPEVDKTALDNAIKAFQSKYAAETAKYSDAVKEAYQEALNAAQAVMNKSDATQQQVADAVTALGTADEALQTLIGNEKTAGKDTFKTTIANIKKEYGGLVTQYSQEVQAKYNEAIEAAEAALNDPAAGKEQIDAAVTALNTAIEALEAAMDQEDEGKTADKTELQAKLNAFKEKYKNIDQYSDTVKKTFEAAAAKAQEILDKENPTVKEVNSALGGLVTADQELTDQIEKETAAGKPDFKDKIKEFKAKYPDLSQYSQEVQNAFKDAVSKAEEVLNNPDASQADIEAAFLALQKAGETLDTKIKEEDDARLPKANKKALKSAIDAAKRKSLKEYTSASATKYKNAITAAQKVYNDANATQKQVDTALKALKNAQKALKYKVPAKGKKFVRGNFEYKVTKSSAKSGTVAISKLTAAGKKKSSLKIPATIKEKGYTFKITEISKNVCKKNNKLTSIEIGANVTKIGASSFNNCKKLGKITFKGSKVPKVTKNAFKGIKKNPKIYYPSKMKKQLSKLKKAMKTGGVKATNSCYKKKG